MKIVENGGEQPTLLPLYGQVRDRLLRRIVQAEWSAGEALPNEFKLASQYSVSIGTIRRAVAALEQHGIVKRVQGRGTYVAGQGSQALIQKFEPLRLRDGNSFVPNFELVSVKREAPSIETATVLGLGPKEDVFAVTKLLYHEKEAVGVIHSFVPASLVPRLEEQLRYGQHLYPLLADYGLIVVRTEESWSADPAGDGLANLLGRTGDYMVLNSRRVAYVLNNVPIEFRTSAFIPSSIQVVHVEQ